MASADWSECTDSFDGASVDRAPTTGITPPNGGGAFVFGFNSLVAGTGAVAFYSNATGFAPMTKGGRISGAVQRGLSGGALNFSPFLFLSLQSVGVDDAAYILGLQDDDPHRIALRKGALIDGVPSGAVGTNGILARSTATFAPGTWVHLQLDVITNPNGDVLLKCATSNLGANPVTTPVWAPIPGIGTIIDDALGVLAGPALIGGHAGFGFASRAVSRRGYFDQIVLGRQL